MYIYTGIIHKFILHIMLYTNSWMNRGWGVGQSGSLLPMYVHAVLVNNITPFSSTQSKYINLHVCMNITLYLCELTINVPVVYICRDIMKSTLENH